MSNPEGSLKPSLRDLRDLNHPTITRNLGSHGTVRRGEPQAVTGSIEATDLLSRLNEMPVGKVGVTRRRAVPSVPCQLSD